MEINSLNIIICTHNRADSLADTLKSLRSVEQPPNIEIIITVVENACTDLTGNVIRNFAQSVPFQVVHLIETVPGKTRALNLALSRFDSDLAVFVDDDHVFPKTFLLSIVHAANSHKNYSGYCGKVIPMWDGSEPKWVHDRSRYAIRPYPIPHFNLGDTIKEINENSFIPGAGNLFLKRSFIKNTGSFNKNLGPSRHNLKGGEDIEYIIRGLNLGERLVYVPNILQYHMVDLERLRLSYLVKKAYLRNKIVRRIDWKVKADRCLFGVPLYLFNILIKNIFMVFLKPKMNQKRYHIVRCGAISGEIMACFYKD